MAVMPDPRQRAWARFITAQAMLLEQIEAAFAEADLPSLAWYDVLWILECADNGWLRMHDLARKAVVSRFPYVVLYREEAGEVVVISVFHTARDPSIWQSRT